MTTGTNSVSGGRSRKYWFSSWPRIMVKYLSVESWTTHRYYSNISLVWLELLLLREQTCTTNYSCCRACVFATLAKRPWLWLWCRSRLRPCLGHGHVNAAAKTGVWCRAKLHTYTRTYVLTYHGITPLSESLPPEHVCFELSRTQGLQEGKLAHAFVCMNVWHFMKSYNTLHASQQSFPSISIWVSPHGTSDPPLKYGFSSDVPSVPVHWDVLWLNSLHSFDSTYWCWVRVLRLSDLRANSDLNSKRSRTS